MKFVLTYKWVNSVIGYLLIALNSINFVNFNFNF